MQRFVSLACFVVLIASAARAQAPGHGETVQPLPPRPAGLVDVTPETWPAPAHSETACQIGGCERGPAFLVSVEYLLVRPRRTDLDYAVIDPADDIIPQGQPTSLAWETRSGLRANLRYRPGGGPNDVGFTYTYVYSTDSGAVTAPAGGLLYATLTRPGTNDEATTAAAFTSLNYNVFDIDVGHTFGEARCFQSRVFTGVRMAIINQVLQASYDGRDANQTFAEQRCNMDGGGLTAGGEAHWSIGRGLTAYGKGRGSLVVGDYRVSNQQTDFAGNFVLTDATDKFCRVVPVLDLGAGVSYRFGGVRASVGYEITHWFNQVEGVTFLDDFSEGKRARRVSDLSLEAIVFGLSFEF
jgi:hypothetical protein